MILALLTFFTGIAISSIAIYYSVLGLTSIFAAAFIPIVVMGTVLEVSKLVTAWWLKTNWQRAPYSLKSYLTLAVVVLMLITSMGIFGFLSKAHSDQGLVSGDVAAKIAVYDEKIKTAKENIEANRKQLKQMDDAVDQIMGRSTSEQGADKSNAVRRSQQKDRAALAKDIEANQKLIASLNEERAPIAAEVRKVEAEVGPIKYIAALIYGDNPDANLLEKSVVWVILTIVFVFDPLAVLLLLASQMSFQWLKDDKKDPPPEEPVSTEPAPEPGPKPEPYRPNFKKTKFEYKGSWPNKKPKMEEPMAAIIPDPVVEPKIESVELVASSDLSLNEVDTKFWNMVEDNVKSAKEQWLADLPEDKEKKEEILKEVGLLTAVDEPIKSKTQTPDEDNLESEKKK
jgi:Spy/CpxP family protein refolding chaperone